MSVASFVANLLEDAFGLSRSATICAACVRDGDAVTAGRFGDYSICGRCRASVTSKTPAAVLLRTGNFECPICRTSHMDACSQRDIDMLLASGPPVAL